MDPDVLKCLRDIMKVCSSSIQSNILLKFSQAQAQEIVWHKAVLGETIRTDFSYLHSFIRSENKSDAVIAKVALQLADLFEIVVRELNRPDYDKQWVSLAQQKKVLRLAELIGIDAEHLPVFLPRRCPMESRQALA